jgi:mediator of RNA polymerase II transcription subunit 5
MQDSSVGDAKVWVDRIWGDPGSHAVFANLVLKVIETFISISTR